ncbi:FtsX-like permease family protein [Treponema primitia]|uniref:ABC transporter permease n=1 Tax=Treponema primitia TaxID=88058 RepID=UPI00398062ED
MSGIFSTAVEIKRIAWRNLFRHKVKTIITVLAVTVSVGLYIFIDGWILGMNLDSRRNIVNYESGAAKLQTKAYFDKKDELPMYESFSNWEQYAAALDKAGYDSAPRFVFTGTLYSEFGSAPMQFIACDPAAEANLLRYTTYTDAGRYIKPGAFEIALGSMTAQKIKAGVPQRPTRSELENEYLAPVSDEADRAFITGLYEELVQKKHGMYDLGDKIAAGDVRLVIKKDLPPEDLERCWNILAATGRMDLRISTVLDIKAAPDSIRQDRYDNDIAPLLNDGERRVLLSAYELDPLTGVYYLSSDDPALLDPILVSLIRIDYTGAVRHVNQLVDAVLVGMINSPNPKNNNNVGYLPMDVLQDESGLMLEGRVTELLIREKNADDSRLPLKSESSETITAFLSAAIPSGLSPELGVFGWLDYAADYIAVSKGDDISSRIIVILLFILSFLGIANTMLLAILERTREIGMMRAMGMTDGQLIGTYMMEAGMVGLLGSVFGIILGCLINIPMIKYGIDYSAVSDQMGGDFGYRIAASFKSAWNVPVIFLSGVVATILSSLMAFLPVKRALKMPVTESLRFE